ncbi:hypothetical protein Acr_00g0072590 [Actinidia rufa]|uniref:Uncharacterized protein n=1 Tax=Actinidia rufa TaxID=165716 RepID=A0A7J0DRW7_9ERIC|nr:hypothetical protein Acr_00g0072590 [Actinidia rufa]
MEKALLGGESSGGVVLRSSRWRDQRSRHFLGRREAITHGSPYERAAALVDLVCLIVKLQNLHICILV